MDSPSFETCASECARGNHPGAEHAAWDVPMRWVIPAEVLDAAFDWSKLPQAPLMILPAQEELWRDSAHYKAYVRPVQEEE